MSIVELLGEGAECAPVTLCGVAASLWALESDSRRSLSAKVRESGQTCGFGQHSFAGESPPLAWSVARALCFGRRTVGSELLAVDCKPQTVGSELFGLQSVSGELWQRTVGCWQKVSASCGPLAAAC